MSSPPLLAEERCQQIIDTADQTDKKGNYVNPKLHDVYLRLNEDKRAFIIPDILCNAGGVTVSYFEWVQDESHLFWEAQDVYNRLEKVMKTAFRDVLKIHLDRAVSMRIAANMLGIGRVAEAIHIRGIYP